MPKYRIEYKRNECIGAGPCAAVDPEHFDIDPSDGKANLKGAKQEGDVWVLEIEESTKELALQAVDVCPVAVISVKEIK